MSMSAITLRQPGTLQMNPAQARERSVRRRISAAWGLLYLNTLVYTNLSILHLPSKIGQVITQGALPLAILLILTVNPKLRVRPNVFLCLMSLLVLGTILADTVPQSFGSVYRTVRFAEYIAALWLLTPWWGRRDMFLLRCHLRWFFAGLGTVVLGLLVAPGHAFVYDGRLTGVIWPMYPTQVALYAAVAMGLMLLLWFGRLVSGRLTLAAIAVATPILLLTHTRTALAAGVAAMLVAGLSLFTVNARVRRFFAVAVAIVSIGVITAAGFLATWLSRGEDTAGLTTLTGRTSFWALVLSEPRTGFQRIFGFGLSNASIDGHPIDSNWFASYQMEGLFGVVICAVILVWLLSAAFFRPHGVERALALFLVTYCLVASVTEVGFTDVSSYLLNLTVAASLLVSPAGAWPRYEGLDGTSTWRIRPAPDASRANAQTASSASMT
jgi:hypothetical protein